MIMALRKALVSLFSLDFLKIKIHYNCDEAADENITIFLCAWVNVVWEISDNNVVTMSRYRRLLSLLLDTFQT